MAGAARTTSAQRERRFVPQETARREKSRLDRPAPDGRRAAGGTRQTDRLERSHGTPATGTDGSQRLDTRDTDGMGMQWDRME